MHRVFQWRRLQRLVVPQERYGERSEPALKRKRLSQPRKESEQLGAPTRRSPSIVSRSGSVRRFLLRGGSFSLSNSVQCSVKPRNDRRHKPGDARKLEEDAAIIQTLTKHGSEPREKARFAAALPGNDAEHLATGNKANGMLRHSPLGRYAPSGLVATREDDTTFIFSHFGLFLSDAASNSHK